VSATPEQKPATRAADAPAPSLGGREKLVWAAFAVLLLLNYLPTLRWMVQRWDEPESYMSHGWLIPFISAWLLWRERRALALALADARGSAGGWFLIAPALLLHLVSGLADVSSISGLTLIPLLLGFVVLRFGWGAARAAWFPVVFLIFMVPPPEFVISGMNFRLKLMAADLAAVVLNSTGLPAVRSGSFMLFGNEKLAIGDVCSGLRSLLSLLSIGVLYAWLIRPKGRAHVLAVLAATVPAAIIGNGLRIGLVSYLVFWLGQAVVFKPLIGSWDLHLFTGAFIFVGALGILTAVGSLVDLAASRRGGSR
jgi:exosortase